MLDHFYISVFNFYKKRLGKQSQTLALFYINLLELSIFLALGSFFLAFANQMKIATMSLSKFWVLFGLLSIFILFKNWMRYNGKKRNILKAKLKSNHSIYMLWILPFACLVIGFILLQVP